MSGFFVGIGIDISHFLFVDDTLIFCGASPNQLRILRGLFLCFEVVLGLKTNLAKSELVPVGNVDNVFELPRIMKRQLVSWKMLYLSKGGRLTLTKGTLSNLPLFFMSHFPIPTGVTNRIKKLQCNFLLGGLGKEFKYHLARWSTMCTPIFEGGLDLEICWASIMLF